MKRIILILLLCPLFIISCSTYLINDAGYTRPPKNYKFAHEKRSAKLKDNNIIDTTAVYYVPEINLYKNSDEYKTGNSYIRFYADGRFKLQGTKTYPKVSDVNDINKGIVGYYKLKENIIRLWVYTDINAGSEQKIIGIINEDKDLILIRAIFSSSILTNLTIGYVSIWNEKTIKKEIEESTYAPKVYKKIYLEGMTYTEPNW